MDNACRRGAIANGGLAAAGRRIRIINSILKKNVKSGEIYDGAGMQPEFDEHGYERRILKNERIEWLIP